MKVTRICVRTATGLALALALVMGISPAAAAERGDALATVATLGDQVAWTTFSGADQLALSVSGPANTNFSERFANGNSPAFSLFDAEGNARPDGTYSWELTEESGPLNDRVRDEANGRDTARHTESQRIATTSRSQSGAFTIKNGVVVDSSLVEVEASRPAAD